MLDRILDSLTHPVALAPMAGGAGTAELCVAVSEAGGLGFLAAGYKSGDAMMAEVEQVRAATERPFGVNLFVPGEPADPDVVEAYSAELTPEAERYGVELPEVPLDDDDDWDAKLHLLLRRPVPVVSFTFGCPGISLVDRLHEVGTAVVVTVTDPGEAVAAVAAGADGLCVQGPEAGAHRGSFVPRKPYGEGEPGLLDLLRAVGKAVQVPLIAAGGIGDGAAAVAARAAGASAVQLGTAFLLTPESGANPVHRAALRDPRYTSTTVTTAFSGRPARGLTNRFILDHADAPIGYPAVHHLTTPIRRAAVAQGDPGGVNLWAGTAWRLAEERPAADVVREIGEAAA
ncbi:nitronate monooxygenase [Microtetraspora sp. NBRC 16547]|uniref:nitronate monooxygenase n=1 Tax=Microtetraspora sp. NBRC 16547 TaxID=3030993 RepID=UPI0024A5D08C|nr:nitronate monooxygenase [Microtetraspora sp. NBRC 16547]GLX00773.1 oxidoreductase [Microtetraspora sp. NBRC 16547]